MIDIYGTAKYTRVCERDGKIVGWVIFELGRDFYFSNVNVARLVMLGAENNPLITYGLIAAAREFFRARADIIYANSDRSDYLVFNRLLANMGWSPLGAGMYVKGDL